MQSTDRAVGALLKEMEARRGGGGGGGGGVRKIVEEPRGPISL